MGNIDSLISALVMTAWGTVAAFPDSYEWWLDNDLSSVKTGVLTGGQLDFQVDTSGLPGGKHTFSCRLLSSDGEPGSIFHTSFFVPDNDSKTRYEYWLDDDFARRVAGEMESADQSFELDLTAMSPGLHCLNYRLGRKENEWGPVFRQGFIVAPDSPEISNEIDAYEYWFDNDFAGRQRRVVDGTTDAFEIDLNTLDFHSGKHWFNLRVCDRMGNWGAVYRTLFGNPDQSKPTRILGYRHYINDINLGYVELDTGISDGFDFVTEIPDKDTLIDYSVSVFGDHSDSDFPVLYVVQLETDCGWMPPFSVLTDIDKKECQEVRISYDGRFLTLETDEEGAEIRYALTGPEPVENALYTESIDVLGPGSITARSVKAHCKDSREVEFNVAYYADEVHAETSEPGHLGEAFEWNPEFPATVESYTIKGLLDESDYSFIESMDALRHLDIKEVNDAHIPDNAFANSKLISIDMPEDLAEYGDGVLSGAAILGSIGWNSPTMPIESRLTDGLANPNVLLFVPSADLIAEPGDLNIVADGNADRIVLHYGYPYYAARDYHAADISLTRDFRQITEPDVCRGWETLVLPFKPQNITHETQGKIVPFEAWDGDTDGDRKPFWLYRSTSNGWVATEAMEEGVPYIISMPNHPDYAYTFNLAGPVTFSASDIDMATNANNPFVIPWIDRTEFVGTYMPVEEDGVLSLNVNETDGERPQGSAFVDYDTTLPFGAYVRNAAGRKAMPVFGTQPSLGLPVVVDDGIVITTPVPGTIAICSSRERKVTVVSTTGVPLHTLTLQPGETRIVEDLPSDLYIVAGVKVMVR